MHNIHISFGTLAQNSETVILKKLLHFYNNVNLF